MTSEYKVLIYVNDGDDVRELYEEHVKKHNKKINGTDFPDSGFDLFCLKNSKVAHGETYTMDSQVVCAVYKNNTPSAYYLYPRSSISKTPLRLANSVGIIDSGYRGNLIAKLDNTGYHKTGIHARDFETQKGDKYVQICMSDLSPFTVTLVDNIESLGTTERGDGGFGSTNHK